MPQSYFEHGDSPCCSRIMKVLFPSLSPNKLVGYSNYQPYQYKELFGYCPGWFTYSLQNPRQFFYVFFIQWHTGNCIVTNCGYNMPIQNMPQNIQNHDSFCPISPSFPVKQSYLSSQVCFIHYIVVSIKTLESSTSVINQSIIQILGVLWFPCLYPLISIKTCCLVSLVSLVSMVSMVISSYIWWFPKS